MDKKFKQEGWQNFKGVKSKDLIFNCINTRNEWLPIIEEVVFQATRTKFQRYKSEHLTEYALVKSIFRSLMRYDNGTYQLAKSVSKELLEALGENGEQYYCTPPYTYVHFPDDISEASEFHIDVDTYEGEYLVIWIPLNDCNHKPITLKPRSHYKLTITQILGIIERKLGVKKLPWFFERIISPDLKKGEFLVWDGRLHHAGNINKSDSIHIVLNFRLSTIPDRFEPTIKYSELQNAVLITKDQFLNNGIKIFAENYIRIYNEIKKNQPWNEGSQSLIEIAKRTLDLIKNWKLSDIDTKRISFGMTLGTMRRPSIDYEVAYINLVANLMAPEYLWSLNSFVKFALGKYKSEEVVEFLLFYYHLYPLKQVVEIINELKKKHPSLSSFNIKEENKDVPYNSWLK
jgi:ectoine hydroxylase-related dioxygenase (phytanoyl-CoA dioxygenase family)